MSTANLLNGLVFTVALSAVGCFELPGDLGGPPAIPVLAIRNTDYSRSVPCSLDIAISDPDGDAISLQFRINGELSLWTSLQPSGSSVLLVVTADDSVELAARSRDTDNNSSAFSPTLPLFAANLPPQPPVGPEGNSAQLIGVADTFYTAAVDPEGDWVSLHVEPGNGEAMLPWSPHYPSGFQIGFVYTYRSAGTFLMRAQARDLGGRLSAWSGGLSVRVRNQPRHISNTALGGVARSLCEHSGFVYIATAGHGLQTINVADPYHPQIVAGHGNYAATIVRRNDQILLALVPGPVGQDSVFAYDITNPGAPAARSRLQVQHANCLDLEANLAVVGSPDPLAEITILDISRPDTLHVISTTVVGPMLSVALRFPYVYAVTYERMLYVLDISTPASPHSIAALSLPDAGPVNVTANRLRIAGQSLPFASYTYNIAQPENPVFIAQRRIMGNGRDIHTANNIMAIAEGIGGFELFELLPTGRPPLIGRILIAPSCEGVYCGISYLYIAASNGGLMIYAYPELGEQNTVNVLQGKHKQGISAPLTPYKALRIVALMQCSDGRSESVFVPANETD